MNMIKAYFDKYFPRFITEYCVFYDVGEHYKLYADVRTWRINNQYGGMKTPDAVAKVSSFNLFGIAVRPRPSGEMMTWSEYLKMENDSAEINNARH